jgi:hypothetical protein
VLNHTFPVLTSIQILPAHSPSSGSAISKPNQNASESSDSGSSAVTPSTSTPAFDFWATYHALPSTSPNTIGGTPQFTAVSPPLIFGAERHPSASFPFSGGPDEPIPSIEDVASPLTTRQSSPSSTFYTPSASVRPGSCQPALDQDSVLSEIGNIGNLRLTSPQTPRASSSTGRARTPSIHTPSASVRPGSCQPALYQDSVLREIGNIGNLRLTSPQTPRASSSAGRARTPSIHVTPSAPTTRSSRSQADRADSLADLTSGTRLGSTRAGSSGAAGLRESRSPSPSRPRGAPYDVACEDHLDELSDMHAVQDAIGDARTLITRIINALSSSNLHREDGSRIHALYQQAVKLHDFQPPSSRIVGLVGNSGAGKSTLINSLLDKMELARAVSVS